MTSMAYLKHAWAVGKNGVTKDTVSKYNHEYYMKNKDKWGVKGSYKENDVEVSFDGEMGETDENEFEKKHGKVTDSQTDVILKAEDGTPVLFFAGKIVASGDILKNVNEKVISKYLDDILEQREALLNKIKDPKEREAAENDINAKIMKQARGLVAKMNGAKNEETEKTAEEPKPKKRGGRRKRKITTKSDQLQHHGTLGMKWGVRKYQNKDGSLTTLGQKRYDRDIKENLSKKKENRIDTSSPDPRRWAKEDVERKKRLVDTSSSLVNDIKKIERETRQTPANKRTDLSKMSDKEMRDKINRELLERQYDKLFSSETEPQVSKGRQYVSNTLEIAGGVLAVTSSALAIALSVKELRG